MDYFVSWEIELTAGSPVEAAQRARAAQALRGTKATVFDVFNDNGSDVVRVDLATSEDDDFGQKPEERITFSQNELTTLLHSLIFLRHHRPSATLSLTGLPFDHDPLGPVSKPPAQAFNGEFVPSDAQIISLCERIEIALS